MPQKTLKQVANSLINCVCLLMEAVNCGWQWAKHSGDCENNYMVPFFIFWDCQCDVRIMHSLWHKWGQNCERRFEKQSDYWHFSDLAALPLHESLVADYLMKLKY